MDAFRHLLYDSAVLLAVATAFLAALGYAMEEAYLQCFGLPSHQFLPGTQILIYRGLNVLMAIASRHWLPGILLLFATAVFWVYTPGFQHLIIESNTPILAVLAFALAAFLCLRSARNQGRHYKDRPDRRKIKVELKPDAKRDCRHLAGTYITHNNGAFAFSDEHNETIVLQVADVLVVTIEKRNDCRCKPT